MPTAMIKLAEQSGFTVARKREDGRLVHLVKDLTAHDQRTSASRRPLGECVIAA